MADPTRMPIATSTSRRVGGRRSRMLAAAALAGAAALMAGCAAGGPAAPSQPASPPTAVTGDDPVPITDARLQAPGLFDEVSAEGHAVRWVTPGESIAIFIGGSGGGGGCIPQPHAAELEGDGAITVPFDPPDPAMACTADFTLHGWELALAEPIDADRPVPVRLVNLAGDDETTEVELGPDDVLETGATADPQPSEVPDSGSAPEPEPIPAAQLPDDPMSIVDIRQDPPVAVQWLEPGVSLAVLLGGSGSEHCVPQPIGATSTGPGTIEVAFEYPVGDMDCSGDLQLYGWQITLPEAVSATLPVEVTVTGAAAEGATGTFTVEPDDVLELR